MSGKIIKRKVRHPYQIMELSEMIVGKNYTFIFHIKGCRIDAECRMFGGIIKGSYKTAKQRGYDLDHCNINLKCFMDLIKDQVVTVHMDGWTKHLKKPLSEPISIYWDDGYEIGYDSLNSWVGPEEYLEDEDCSIVVPSRHWNNDPVIHVLDWINPDCVVNRVCDQKIENASDWEIKMKNKKHDAMRKMLGFE